MSLSKSNGPATRVLALGYGATKTRRWKKWLSFVKRFGPATAALLFVLATTAQAGGSFWFYHFARPGQVVFNSRAYDTQEACEEAATVKYNQGKFLVGRCQDSDNAALTGD